MFFRVYREMPPSVVSPAQARQDDKVMARAAGIMLGASCAAGLLVYEERVHAAVGFTLLVFVAALLYTLGAVSSSGRKKLA